MHHKFTRHAQILYALMVPITFVAFKCASLTLQDGTVDTNTTIADIAGMILVGLGVFVHNIFKQKPQKASIEDDF